MKVIGKTSEELAIEFVQSHPKAKLGSKAKCGLRRVVAIATGDALKAITEQFRAVAVTMAEPVAATKAETVPPDCVYLGSKRNTCCGSPDMWICRLHNADCVATEKEKGKLQSMLSTDASGVRACDGCEDRKTSIP